MNNLFEKQYVVENQVTGVGSTYYHFKKISNNIVQILYNTDTNSPYKPVFNITLDNYTISVDNVFDKTLTDNKKLLSDLAIDINLILEDALRKSSITIDVKNTLVSSFLKQYIFGNTKTTKVVKELSDDRISFSFFVFLVIIVIIILFLMQLMTFFSNINKGIFNLSMLYNKYIGVFTENDQKISYSKI